MSLLSLALLFTPLRDLQYAADALPVVLMFYTIVLLKHPEIKFKKNYDQMQAYF
jgi:hypothetical protein